MPPGPRRERLRIRVLSPRARWVVALVGTLTLAGLRAHDPPASLRALNARIAEHPADPTLYLARGEVLLSVSAPAAALADFERAGALRADLPALDLARGRALRALGRHTEAAAAAAGALARDPRSTAAAVLCARSLAALGRHDDALVAWDRALELAVPAPPEFYLERADAAVAARAVGEAILGLERGLRDLGPVITLQERAIALCEHSGRYDEAAHRLDCVLAAVDRPEHWLAWKARVLDRAGRAGAASAARQAAWVALQELPAARRGAPAARALHAGLAQALRVRPFLPAAALLPAAVLPPPNADRTLAPPPWPTNTRAPKPGVVLLPRGTWWRYLDTGVDIGVAWRAPAFDDSIWFAGVAQLGFGDGDESWVVNGGPANNRHATTYFRRAFHVPDPTIFTLAHLELLRDDGAVVYLNGTEIARSNMPAGTIGYGTLATRELSGPDERVFSPIAFAPSLLVAGTNVVAVEVHQASAASDDLSFDLELVATRRLAVARGPYVQLATPTAATVRWRTDAPCATGLWLGPSPASLALVSASAQPRTEHEVRVSGLTPSTRYYYAVGDGVQQLAGATSAHWLMTAPPPGAAVPIRMWALGDSGTADANARAVRDAYLAHAGARRTDVLLMLGDNAYYSGTDEEYQRGVFDTYPTILGNTCLWPTLGNHDAISARSATGTGPYYDAFTLPAQGEAGGLRSGTEAYYAFDHGNVHFVCLDSQDSDRSPMGAMVSWLAADLRATTAEWVIAFFHHPPYTKGSHDSDNGIDSDGRLFDMRENVLPVLEAHGVDLVLTGHSHSYERSYLLHGHYDVSSTLTDAMKLDRGDGNDLGDGAYVKAAPALAPKQGAVYVVAGSAGMISGGSLDHPAHVVSLNALGSLVVDVDGPRLDALFLDATGSVRDRFTIKKGTPRWLVRDEPAISVANGGVQTLSITAGTSHANRQYVVAGSLGTVPGFTRNGVHVPLNPDGWFSSTLMLANGAFLQNTVGRLDGMGMARARIVLPRLPASLAGIELYHAAVVLQSGRVVGASEAVKLRLVP